MTDRLPPNEGERDVMNVEQAAAFLGFAPYTIREKAREGQIPGRKIGGEWRFGRRTLLAFIENAQPVETSGGFEKELERLGDDQASTQLGGFIRERECFGTSAGESDKREG